jgi:homocitrate synthase NifV
LLSDTTLRDGEQSYGIVFNNQERPDIIHALNTLEIAEVEVEVAVGFPALPKSRTAYIEDLVRDRQKGHLQCKLLGWYRPVYSEIVASAKRGLDGCAVSIPACGQYGGRGNFATATKVTKIICAPRLP